MSGISKRQLKIKGERSENTLLEILSKVEVRNIDEVIIGRVYTVGRERGSEQNH